MSAELNRKVAEAREILRGYGRVAVAFSGGVDSSVLLRLALDALGRENVLAVTAAGPIYPRFELGRARTIAETLGARHRVVESVVHRRDEFIRNTPQRCYHCKKCVMGEVLALARAEGASVVAGENVDDGLDYRPGHRALQELGVHTPLREAGLTKADIRSLAREWGLPNWNDPATPCLATRIPYGQPIEPPLLRQIDEGEEFLRGLGFRVARLRVHGPVARIEVGSDEVARCLEPEVRRRIVETMRGLGFEYVTVDLEGYRLGSLNRVLPADEKAGGRK